MNNLALDYVEKLRVNAERDRYRALILKREDNFKQKMYKNGWKFIEAINNIDENNYVDIYCSMNTFVKPKRSTENICQLEHLYIDLDCYKVGMTKESAIYFLENDHYNMDIPKPNTIVDSGNGLYLIWNIRPVPLKALPLWAALQRYLYETLKYLGADPRCLDAARFLRMPGSKNSSNGKIVHVIYEFDYRYELKELKEGYLKEIIIKDNLNEASNKKRNKRVRNILYFYNEYSLNKARMDDLLKLCELREYDMQGYRETTLFLYRYFNCIELDDEEKALEDALELNQMFARPLKVKEVINATQSAERYYKDRKYKFTTRKLIEILGISEDEEKKLKFIISTKEKYKRNNERRKNYRRNDDGLTTRQLKHNELKEKIKILKEKGLTQVEVCKNLEISLRCVKYNWK